MKNIVFIAPPAAGKGTLSELLIKKYDYEHISTGNLLREEAKKNTLVAKKIREIQASGKLVGDDIVNELLENKLKSISKPFILDGYPRTLLQAEKLEKILLKLNKTLDVVIYLDVPYSILLKRTVGRLVCTKCGSSFNEYFLETKPKTNGVCDLCNSPLFKRSDDTEQTFLVRYNEFIENTKPLIDFYQKRNMLCKVDKVDTPQVTLTEIESVIKW